MIGKAYPQACFTSGKMIQYSCIEHKLHKSMVLSTWVGMGHVGGSGQLWTRTAATQHGSMQAGGGQHVMSGAGGGQRRWVTDAGGGVVIDAGKRWPMCGDHVGVVVDGGGCGG